jgi:putative flippase GtrA
MGAPVLPRDGATFALPPLRRHWPLAARIVRYGVAGASVSILYSLAVITCMHIFAPLSPTVASVIAYFAILPLAYLAHGRFSFSDRPYDSLQPIRFTVSTTSSFIVAIGGMYWITEIAGRSYLLGIAWNWLMIPAMNLLIYMVWVFRTLKVN